MQSQNFFAYQWSVKEEEDFTTIRVYGFTKDNKNVYVKIDNFTPYCYIELPTNIEWTQSKLELVCDKLSSLNRKKYQPVEKEFIMKKKLYYAWKEKTSDGYRDKLFPFLFFKFRSTTALKNFSYTMKKEIDISGIGKIKFNIHENEGGVSPVLKLLSIRKLPSAGWIRVKGTKVSPEDKESSFDIEINCDYKNLFPVEDSSIVKPRVLSFDIEANSTITSAMPDASKPNDKVFQIGFVTCVDGKVQKYLHSLGKPDKSIVGDDVIVNTYKTEADLLVSFRDFIREGEYNVIIGYNILGWDFQYMINRAKFTKCLSEFDTIGCIDGVHDAEVAPQFESKAYSAQKLVYLDSEGRLYLDLLPIIKREHKLVNYRLETVLKNFGLPSKDPLKAQGIFSCYREFSPSSLGKVGKYCVNDSYVTYLLYEKIQMWFGLCEMAKTAHVPIFYLFSKGTQIQMFSQITEYCMYNNYVIISNGYTPREDEEYMGAIVLTPVPGKYRKVLSFDFASLYPSIMMAYNIDYSTLVPEPTTYIIGVFNNTYSKDWNEFPCILKVLVDKDVTVVKKNIKNTLQLEDEVEEIRKKYEKKMILIQTRESDIPDCDCNVFFWEDHSGCDHDENRKKKKNGEYSQAKRKVICGQRYYRFMKSEVCGKGVVPVLLENHISSRKQTRKEIAKNEDEITSILVKLIKNNDSEFIQNFRNENPKYFENIENDVEKCAEEVDDFKTERDRVIYLHTFNQVLDKRQSSKKICANSMYGAMGVKKGYLPLMPGASTITYRGRKAIEFISTYIPENYGGITVYGDTDSSHIYFPHIKDNKEAVDLAESITKEMEKFFPAPMKLEFEKVYEKYIILTKKRYMAQVANKKGEIIDFTKRGVVLSRRDNMKILRDIYLKSAMSLLDNIDRDTILNDIIDCINGMFQRKHSFKEFVIAKALGRSEYKAKTLPAHVQLAERLKNRGIPVSSGSRIEYLFTDKLQGEKNFNQGDIVEDVDYFSQWKSYYRVGYLHYLERQFMKPLDELLHVGLGIEGFVKKQYELRVLKFRITEQIKDIFRPKIQFEGVEEIVKKVREVKKREVVKNKSGKSDKKREMEFESDDEDCDTNNTSINTNNIEVDEKSMWKKYSSL